MSEEQSPVEVVAEEASAQYDNTVSEVLTALAANGKNATPNDFKEVLQNIKQAVDEKLEEEGVDTKSGPDPDRFLKLARQIAVNNYNENKTGRSKLKADNVHIVWYSKTLSNWKAIIASPIVRNVLWEVTYNGYKKEAYVDAYKKTGNVKVEGIEI